MTSSSQLGTHRNRAAIRFEPEHRCCCSRRAGRPSMRLAASCPPTCRAIRAYRKVNPADAPILMLGLDVGHDDGAADVRCRRLDPGTEAGAGGWSGTGLRVGIVAARGARGSESDSAEQTGNRTRHGAQCAECRQRESPEGIGFERHDVVFASPIRTSSLRPISTGRSSWPTTTERRCDWGM